MNSLNPRTLHALITAVDNGEMSEAELASHMAKQHVLKSGDNGAQVLVLGALVTGAAWVLTGGFIVPAVTAYIAWEKFREVSKGQAAALDRIGKGYALEYLPEAERETFQGVEGLKSADDDVIDAKATAVAEPALLPLPAEIGQVLPAAGGPVMPLPLDARKALIAQLEADCPALLDLIKSHPMRVVGIQRTGKTTLVKLVVLLRMLLIEGHRVTAATPHTESENSYPSAFEVVGIGPGGTRDYPAIANAWEGMAAQIAGCNAPNRTYVWDEFGTYGEAIPATEDNPDPIKSVLASTLRESKKFEVYPVFIVHGETAFFLPGSPGLVKVFLKSTIRVETFGEQVKGDDGLPTMRPTGRFEVTDFNEQTQEGKIPEWLTERYLLGLLNLNPSEPQGFQAFSGGLTNYQGQQANMPEMPTQGQGSDSEAPAFSVQDSAQIPERGSNAAEPLNAALEGSLSDSDSSVQRSESVQNSVQGAERGKNVVFFPLNAEPEREKVKKKLASEVKAELALQLIADGSTREEAICKVFKVKKGGSKAYKAAIAAVELAEQNQGE